MYWGKTTATGCNPIAANNNNNNSIQFNSIQFFIINVLIIIIIIIIIIQFNSILYYLCAESTATRPITDTAQ
jgi:hypothetical protein